MKKKVLFAAMALVALASCSDETFVGDVTTSPQDNSPSESNAIVFASASQGVTRADIVGSAAADLLGKGFYVVGTKGSEGTDNPSETLVLDNYLVHYDNNTAGKTESNTANWEYVGITPGTGSYTNWVKLSSLNAQSIKYWDYSTAQYDFLAFSTGNHKAVSKTEFTGATDVAVQTDEIGVTAMKYGAGLANGADAYTFYIPTIAALREAYITDVITVGSANYGKEVKLTFKNLGSKIRLALYETVPGYSVKDVVFYKQDGTTNFTDGDANPANDEDFKSTTAALISADGTNGFSTKGTAVVSFPNVGTSNNSNGNYKKASVSVTPVAPAPAELIISQTFGELNNFQGAEHDEDAASYLGRNITQATYAGYPEVDYYQVVFPVTNSKPLTLRVDYTLVSTDGSDEEIHVYGAKAVVPSTYTVWQPNYAYTYIFKISDNTNGWTTATGATTDNQGLYPITFDAVVAEIKDVSGEQTTVTTVAAPSITTYQQGHDHANKDEYSKTSPASKNIYVQVMDNTTTTTRLVGFDGSSLYKLNATTSDPVPTNRSLLYAVTGVANPTEALVMDALQNQSSVSGAGVITGRNSVVLTPHADKIDATVETIVNGVDDQPIDLRDKNGSGDPIENSGEGKAAEIDITLDAGTYAYVYDYSDAAKTTKTFYQPTGAATGTTIANGTKYITLEKLATIGEKTSSESADDAYIYFSKTTDGVNITYSYYSIDGKTGNLPDDLLKVSKSTDLLTGNGTVTVPTGAFVFDIYTRNTGKYAVKVIKIED